MRSTLVSAELALSLTLLVGAGLLGGSMILSLEQMLIDAELFRMCCQARRGIVCDADKWMEEEIDRIGPGGHFLDTRATAQAVRGAEWYMEKLGINATFEEWEADGKPDLAAQAGDMVDQILSTHQPLTLEEDIVRELARIQKSAAKYPA